MIADASVAIAWAIETQATPLTRASLVYAIEHGFTAPHHFPIEIANGLLRAERMNRAGRNDIDQFMLDFSKLKLQLDQPADSGRLSAIVTLGRRYMLSGYDAAYLELALRLGLPLATRDKALAQAAEKAGATLFKE